MCGDNFPPFDTFSIQTWTFHIPDFRVLPRSLSTSSMSPKAKTLRLAGARGLIRRWVLCYHRIAGSGIRRLLDAKREGTPRPSCIFFCTTLSTCVLFFRLLRNVSGQIRHLHACRLLGGRAIRPYVTLFRVCFAVHSHIMTCTCTFSGHSPVRRLSLCTTRTRNGHEFGYKSCLRLSGWFSVSLSIFAERNTS